MCLDLGWVGHDVPVGHPDFGHLFPCECRAAEISARLQARSGLYDSEKIITLADVVKRGDCSTRAVKWATLLLESGSGFLTIWGGPGNGKTMILLAVVNHCIQRGIPAVYFTFTKLVNLIRKSNSHEASDSDRDELDRLISIPCLAIDEVDKPKETEWLYQFRHELVDDRSRAALDGKSITLFAMNRSPDEIFDAMPELVSRLRDGRFAFEYDARGQPIPAVIENTESDARSLLKSVTVRQ